MKISEHLFVERMKHLLMRFISTLRVLALALPLAIPASALAQGAPMMPSNRSSRNSGHQPAYLSPIALAPTLDGKQLFIACATAKRVLLFDTVSEAVIRSISVPEAPLGLTLSPDGKKLFVTCAGPESVICVIDAAGAEVTKKIATGHTAMAPVCSPDGKTLYVCNRFNDCVAVIDLAKGKQTGRIPVPREPVAAALTPDGRYLFVANHIHTGPADVDDVAASVSVIDTSRRELVKDIALPNGATTLRDIRISPNGEFACVTHTLGRFHLPTTQIERGWINNNAFSVIDVNRQTLLNTVLLDNIDSGAANPWAAGWTADGKRICVTHAGTHEVSVIDAQALLDKLAQPTANSPYPSGSIYSRPPTGDSNVPNDLAFLVGLRQRIKLDQKGPRPLALIGSRIYVGNYFSDSLSVIDLSATRWAARNIALAPAQPMSEIRLGELSFNDATLCFQGWQSCASCHSSDARVDGLNWDLLNDGIGNPKNAKSLLLANLTAPLMSLGVRSNLQAAVRAGFRYILFSVPPEKSATAVDRYLESLKPIPSPYLVKGRLSKAAERGKRIFTDKEARCASCHPAGLFTDLKLHNVGTAGKYDKPMEKFVTPTLVELWRTAPYLHDGSAATMRQVFTTHNRDDQHGKTSHLTPQQIDDLVEYVLSL